MITFKKIEPSEAKGKNVVSYDPRKPAIMVALKRASGCRKVTMVKELAAGGFTGNCMYGPTEACGFWFVSASMFEDKK
jgi:hypothetical protein